LPVRVGLNPQETGRVPARKRRPVRINTYTFPSYIFPNDHISFAPDIYRKDYHRMVKGPPVHATTIIFCTEYSEPRSFLPPSYPTPSKADCRLIVPLEWPTVVYMGHLRFKNGAIGPAAEMQARRVTQFSGMALALERSRPNRAPVFTILPDIYIYFKPINLTLYIIYFLYKTPISYKIDLEIYTFLEYQRPI
jgi:hypothetical protein